MYLWSFLQRFSFKRAPEEPQQYGAYCMGAVPVDTGRVTQGLQLSCRRAEVMVRIAQINRKEMLPLEVKKKIFNCPFHFKNGFWVSPPLFFCMHVFSFSSTSGKDSIKFPIKFWGWQLWSNTVKNKSSIFSVVYSN